MKIRQQLHMIAALVIFLALVGPVSAIPPLDLNALFYPFQGINIAYLYQTYYQFIDTIIYLLLFLGLSKAILTPIYNKGNVKAAKPIIIGISLALTFAGMMFELNTGFNFGKLDVIAALIFFLLLGVLMFNALKMAFDDPGTAFCITYIIMYALLITAFAAVFNWIASNTPLIATLMFIILIVCIIALVIKAFKLIPDREKKEVKDSTSSNDRTRTEDKKQDNTTRTEMPNTVVITFPEAEKTYLPTKPLYPKFTAVGPAFNKKFNYMTYINGQLHENVIKAKGNYQTQPSALRATDLKPTNELKVLTYDDASQLIKESNVVKFYISAAAPVTSPELAAKIEDMAKRIQDLHKAYMSRSSPPDYASEFQRIIAKHISERSNPSTGPTVDDWKMLQDAKNELIALEMAIQKMIRDISNDTGFPSLDKDTKKTFAQLMIAHTVLAASILDFERNARIAYNTYAAAPTPREP